MHKTIIVGDNIICKCGKNLGIVENSKAYLCPECEIVYFTNEHSVKLNELRKKGLLKNRITDWLK